MNIIEKPSPVFVTRMAFFMSIMAISIDAILPALNQISSGLNIHSAQESQLIISIVFMGMAVGILLYGPLSDAWGRKKPLTLGISIFVVGTLISYFSASFSVMLIGRFLQGFGASACRVISIAMIRDKYRGPSMGKVMSLIMMVFILVPAIAPTLGQFILSFGDWHYIFLSFLVLAVAALFILCFFQSETLETEARRSFSIENLKTGIVETLRNPISRNYTIISGLVFGAFVGYISMAQPLLQNTYQLGDKFSYYFGSLALFLGVSSFLNSKLLEFYSMSRLVKESLKYIFIFSVIFLIILFVSHGEASLIAVLIYLGSSFLCIGILFGNLNALAMEPLGHIAGLANSVISSIQTLIGFIIGGTIASLFEGSVYPLVFGFFVMSLISLVFLRHSEKKYFLNT